MQTARENKHQDR